MARKGHAFVLLLGPFILRAERVKYFTYCCTNYEEKLARSISLERRVIILKFNLEFSNDILQELRKQPRGFER
jgi:hypothetical protein